MTAAKSAVEQIEQVGRDLDSLAVRLDKLVAEPVMDPPTIDAAVSRWAAEVRLLKRAAERVARLLP
jgi:uncharacterized membrane protein